jgi:protein-S-isoprenylcysteine O-methyltransferase Ste14
MWSSIWLAVRSVIWAIVFPGMVAGYIPWRFFGVGGATFDGTSPGHVFGLACITAGASMLAWCIFEFARRGRGTLSVFDPTSRLVVHGLYRYVRNPMYLSVTMIVLGEAVVAGSKPLAIYWAVFFAAANVFVIAYEEPDLRRKFGASYDEYTRRVGRWIPSLNEHDGASG